MQLFQCLTLLHLLILLSLFCTHETLSGLFPKLSKPNCIHYLASHETCRTKLKDLHFYLERLQDFISQRSLR